MEPRNNDHHLQAPAAHYPWRRELRGAADGRLLSDSVRDPLTDGARILLAEGVDPAEPLVLRHEGSEVDCLTSTVGRAAGLRVTEGDHPVRFIRYQPYPRRVTKSRGEASRPAPGSDSQERERAP